MIPGLGEEGTAVLNSHSACAHRMCRLAGGTLTAALLAFAFPAIADVRILASSGGAVGDYLAFFAKVSPASG
jgi:hypothetical protein